MSLQPIPQRESPIQWCIAMTEPGREARAWDWLREQGFTAYLPMETVWKTHRSKPRERVERPLFVGYMFVGVLRGIQSHGAVKAIHGIRGFVMKQGYPAEIDPLFVYGMQASQCAGEFNRTPPPASDPKPDAPPTVTVDLTGPYSEDIKAVLEADEWGRAAMLLSDRFRVKKEVAAADLDHMEQHAA